jgi:hypothetical protein
MRSTTLDTTADADDKDHERCRAIRPCLTGAEVDLL